MFENLQRKQRGFRRLYLQIYLTVAISLVLVVAAAAAIFRLAMDSAPASHALEMAGVVIMAALPPPVAWLAFLLLGALAVALAAWPLVRRLTRRLERLQQSVEALGAGDLSARVRVEGRDEIAALAESFNRAAARIENLVSSHRMLLANTSHELRTPLARIRMGMELLNKSGDAAALDPKRRADLQQDIAEIDSLIEEILLASRLDAAPMADTREEVDLLALAAEEASRQESYGVEGEAWTVEGEALVVQGEARLLRRMVRNILDNARRYGAAPVSVSVERGAAGTVVLRVRDHGSGAPEAERERIFEPFYRVAGSVSAQSTEGYTGTGLGLSLVRRIARHHGGEARCEAVAGAGTCIAVSLPAS